ncbi:MAG: biotin--[acetyl-CoA-carboxylase] ligase [Ignavibacteriales bacterium]|nr:biotin--[acetyl-CoA-carboxylase] ligase [Ignavibacteriales bacterium]
MYTKQELLQGLATQVIGKKIFVFETIDSTNACAHTLGDASAEEGGVVVANFQTNGRGRLGRPWHSEPESSLLFSVLLRPDIQVESSGLLTLYASVAVARAIEQCIGEPVECKWPNDLLLHGKKFCGILLENSLQQSGLAYAVVGVGVNVNQSQLPPEISERATSLALETGRVHDRKAVFHAILREMDGMYVPVRGGDFSLAVSEWTRRCTMFGKTVKVQQHEQAIEGTALRLNHDAGLIISTTSGMLTVYAGDVTLVS